MTKKITSAVTPSLSLCTVQSASFYHPDNGQLGISAAFQYVLYQLKCFVW